MPEHRPDDIQALYLGEDIEEFRQIAREWDRDEISTFQVQDVEQAEQRLAEQSVDLVLIEPRTESNTLRTIETLKNHSPTATLIVLDDEEHPSLGQRAMERGVQDYLVKDELSGHQLQRALRYAVERSRIARQLQDSERRFRQMAENIEDVFWLSTLKRDRMLYVNPAYEQIWGRPIEELYEDPDSFLEAVHPEDRPGLEEAIASVEDPGYQLQYRIQTPDGSRRWIRERAFPIRDKSGTPYRLAGLAQDTTEYKELQQELHRSNKELEQFAYVVSHDLQEPLRMVTSYLELIEKRYGNRLDEDAHEFIDYAVDGAARMKDMINDLLTYSRVHTRGQEPEPVEVEEVLQSVLDDFQVRIRETGAEVQVDPLPRVTADPSQLRQLFQNLLENALKYRSDEPPEIRVTAEKQGDRWKISVADNGIGIPPEQTDEIFRIFRRVHKPEKYSGTGLGLALCRNIVRRHGGKIDVESEPGQGSTFYFTLPEAISNGT